MSRAEPPAGFGTLLRRFLPLSLSDVAMALGDPLVTAALARLPDAGLSLGALGVAKSVAVFLESPIIMLLHASNALAPAAASRKALWRLMLLAASVLTGVLLLLSTEPVFSRLARTVFGLDEELSGRARLALLVLAPWPAAIAWRRYFQGLLIHGGLSAAVARAGLLRLAALAGVLACGCAGGLPGARLGALALVSGVLVEALAVTSAAWRARASLEPRLDAAPGLPADVAGAWRFYRPLANSMLVVWGGRALLLAVVARAQDGPAALAAWPAAWGLVSVAGNATRMVQQVVIGNRSGLGAGLLAGFVAAVGGSCSLLLLAIAASPPGLGLLSAFVGHDPPLLAGVRTAVLLCSATPLLVAVQNALQGVAIAAADTRRVNQATWLGTSILLLGAWLGVRGGLPGAVAAAAATALSLIVETAWLALSLPLAEPSPPIPAAPGR